MTNHNIPERALKLNSRALESAKRYLTAECELITIFQELDANRDYLYFGVTSLIGYGIEVLKLSESAAANIVTVARKAVEFPELKAAVQSGEVTISKARRIAPVITQETKMEWIELAKTSTSRVVEKEVARAQPELGITEKLKYKNADRLELTLGISERLSSKLSRAKDLLSQQNKKIVSSEEAFESALDILIEKLDPIKKAERAEIRNEKKLQHGPGRVECGWITLSSSGEIYKSLQRKNKRAALPSVVKHAVSLRDLRQCTHTNIDGKRCRNTRWLDIHHIVPIARRGDKRTL